MDSKERSSLCELKIIQGQEETEYYLHSVLYNEGQNGIHLCLTDVEDVWEGDLSSDELDLLGGRLKMDFNAYVEQTVAALTKDKFQDVEFEYQLKALPSDKMQLVWKKCVPEDEIKIQLGSVPLKRSEHPPNQIRNIFTKSVALLANLKSQIQDLQSSCERLAQDRQNAVKRLDKCVSAKEDLEKDLYSKFAAVLNSKKERIRDLEENPVVPDLNNGSSSPAHTSATYSDRAVMKRRCENEDNSEDSASEEGVSPIKQMYKPNSRTTTQLDESSLRLDDDEVESTSTSAAPAARRPRRREPVKKQTPSKPVLPRSSSNKSNPDCSKADSVSRRTSLRKSGSNSSSKNSDVDPDDLLGEM